MCLSAILGFIGAQHFYLGRYGEGVMDVALTIGWIYFFFRAKIIFALIFLGFDFLHAFITTIMLLTGSFADGKGKIVCYPGQNL